MILFAAFYGAVALLLIWGGLLVWADMPSGSVIIALAVAMVMVNLSIIHGGI